MATRYELYQSDVGIPYLVAEGKVGDGDAVINSPEKVRDFLNSDPIRLGFRAEEMVYMVTTDIHMRARAVFRVSHGTVSESLLSSRAVFSRVLMIGSGAVNIFVVHNHPGGDTMPSGLDDAIAEKLMSASELLDVYMRDFMILSRNDYYSYLENGKMH